MTGGIDSTAFINRLREEHDHEDSLANEEYRAPMRKVHFENGSLTGHAPVVAETEEEALETFDELTDDDVEATEVWPTDEQVEELTDRQQSHLHREADRRATKELRGAMA